MYVPAHDANDVTESGISIEQAEGVKFLRMEDDVPVYEIGSGKYTFVSKM